MLSEPVQRRMPGAALANLDVGDEQHAAATTSDLR